MANSAIWITSFPRTGSMWTFNIVREIYKNHGFKIFPEEVQKAEEEWVTCRQDFAVEQHKKPDPTKVCVLKTHTEMTGKLLENDKFFMNIRDPRDALISYTRFMQHGDGYIDENWKFVLNIRVKFVTHYFQHFREKITIIKYHDIIEKPEFVVYTLANSLGFSASDADLALAETYSRKRVKADIERKEKEFREKGKDSGISGDVVTPNQKPRFIEMTSGFQTGHVSDYEEGQWREMVSPQLAREMTEFLKPFLEAFEYEI